jgi:hypothetical protein
VTSHPSPSGAKSPEQSAANAAAGDRLLTAREIDGLLAEM